MIGNKNEAHEGQTGDKNQGGATNPIHKESDNHLSDGLHSKKLGQKLPPINISKDYEQGPSKPQILDKYKNDPLIYGSANRNLNNSDDRDVKTFNYKNINIQKIKFY